MLRPWTWRAPFLLALAGLLAFQLQSSSLVGLVALLPSPPAPLVAWIAAALVLALVPALVVRGSPLGATLAVVVPVLVVSAYGAGRIDWLRVLKDFGVQEEDALDLARLALGALSLLLAWALHVADLALRLRSRAQERGIVPEQARAGSAVVLRAGASAGGVALACAGGLALLGMIALGIGAIAPATKAAFIAPVLAALLLAGAGVWLARSS